MKKTVLAFICVLVLLLIFPLTAHADMGPKPSVVIDFKGLQGETYYATLLSQEKTTGPFSAIDDFDESTEYEEGDENYEIFMEFAQYEDADGFYFLQYFKDCSQTQQFSWTYYPPGAFKILLYFPETDRFVTSDEIYERYAFDSYYTYTYSEEAALSDSSAAEQSTAEITVKKSHGFMHELLALLGRMLITIAVELIIALLFGFAERKQIIFITLINVATQVFVNLPLYITNYNSGSLMFILLFIPLEIAVFIIEAALYTWYFEKHSEDPVPGWKSWLYAFIANAATFILGIVLSV